MTRSMRAYRIGIHVVDTLMALSLVLGSFLLFSTWKPPFQAGIVIVVLAIMVIVGGKIAFDAHAGDLRRLSRLLVVATGMSIFAGMCMFHASDAPTVIFEARAVGIVLTMFAASVTVTAMQGIWQERSLREQYDELPYLLWRRGLRALATDDALDDLEREEVLLHLRMPMDEDIISERLPSLERYASFDLSLHGWPHRHSFGEDKAVLEEGDEGDVQIVTYESKCQCGVTRTTVLEETLKETHYGVCPSCGNKVVQTEEEIWMGGHVTFATVYVCTGCGRSDTEDFSGNYWKYDEKVLSTTYS